MFSSNATQVSAVTQAEAVDFDGTNDYLRRTSDLTGNTTSKTFTFSTWIWQGNTSTSYMYVVSDGTNQRFVVRVVGNGTISVEGTANTNSVILSVTAPLANNPRLNTFYHVLISMDMANAANRSIYINDVAQTLTVTTYTNTAIPFNQVDHVIAGTQGGSAGDLGRLSNVFLDYTYRDMSVTANRRLFITADLKPAAGQAALSPILYLPMSNPTTVGTNAGTGGNFTLTGTVARSGRGPNQYNAAYSTFSGSQFLSRTSNIMSGSQPTALTFSVTFRISGGSGDRMLFIISDVSDLQARIYAQCNSVNQVSVFFYNAARTAYITWQNGQAFAINRNYTLTVSYDCSNGSKSAQLNGVNTSSSISISGTPPTSFGVIQTTPRLTVGAWFRDGGQPTENYFSGNISNVYLNTSYIDLSVASNLAKFVSGTGIDAKPVDLGATGELPTGTSPLIYLPMYGNNAGKNYGTGGDFTVNSGPYTGARGPNEFWGNKTVTTNGYLNRTSALSGVSDGNKFSLSFWFRPGVSGTNQALFSISTAGGTSLRFFVFRTSTNALRVYGRNSSGTIVFDVITTGDAGNGFLANNNYYVQIGIDLSNAGSRSIYVNGVSMASTTTWTTYNTAGVITFSQVIQAFMSYNSSGTYTDLFNGQLSEFYFTTDYIDFSQEANRLKFRDAFGNPTDLPSAITAASVPTPAVYMRFPPTSFGTNSGTGGDFTVNGTITDGGQL